MSLDKIDWDSDFNHFIIVSAITGFGLFIGFELIWANKLDLIIKFYVALCIILLDFIYLLHKKINSVKQNIDVKFGSTYFQTYNANTGLKQMAKSVKQAKVVYNTILSRRYTKAKNDNRFINSYGIWREKIETLLQNDSIILSEICAKEIKNDQQYFGEFYSKNIGRNNYSCHEVNWNLQELQYNFTILFFSEKDDCGKAEVWWGGGTNGDGIVSDCFVSRDANLIKFYKDRFTMNIPNKIK